MRMQRRIEDKLGKRENILRSRKIREARIRTRHIPAWPGRKSQKEKIAQEVCDVFREVFYLALVRRAAIVEARLRALDDMGVVRVAGIAQSDHYCHWSGDILQAAIAVMRGTEKRSADE